MSIARLRSIVVVVAGTVSLAYLCYILRASETVAATIFLFAVFLAGVYTRLCEAIVTSVVAAICLDYFFIPPVKSITVRDPEGWLALLIFLGASLFATNLSTRLRGQRDELGRRQKEAERLHALSRFMLLGSSEDVRRLIVNKCIELFGFAEVALFDSATGEVRRSQSDSTITDEALKHTALYGSLDYQNQSGTVIAPISLGNKAFGSLGLRGSVPSQSTIQSLVDTVAVGLAQAQALEASSRADAFRQSEELKSAMIDALAHDLNAPLSRIEAASDMLLPGAGVTSKQQNLLKVIREESQALKRMLGQALHLARIDAKRLRLQSTSVPPVELIQAALQSLAGRIEDHDMIVDVPPALPAVLVDRELAAQVVSQLVDNALKYSPPRSAIRISANENGGLVTFSVRDDGQGLSEAEQKRVFDKFYRGRQDRAPIQEGTGMGLAIAREIVEAHGGSISVESRIGQGSRFTFSLQTADAAVGSRS